MTLYIYRTHGYDTIQNVKHILTHSAGSSDNGIDIEVHTTDSISYFHLGQWDYYSIDC